MHQLKKINNNEKNRKRYPYKWMNTFNFVEIYFVNSRKLLHTKQINGNKITITINATSGTGTSTDPIMIE